MPPRALADRQVGLRRFGDRLDVLQGRGRLVQHVLRAVDIGVEGAGNVSSEPFHGKTSTGCAPVTSRNASNKNLHLSIYLCKG